ncbi:hypothetical protein ACFW1A_01005 [Kitasatospora sp. NPDC058965]|uniref:hypothetical protein n=1 Tax=Kitasatospora sp. NPDC058965 TaxID=3346682 RepID=UPI00368EAD74
MSLRFIGKDPDSPDGDSPTVWVDDETRDLVIQGWKTSLETEEQCRADGKIPEHETVVRVPARLARVLREALDVAERDED